MHLKTASAEGRSRSHPMSDRMAATLVGVLFIIGTVAGILFRVATRGGHIDGPDYLADAEALGRRLPTGALLTVVMGLSLAFIPVVVYPVLRATSQRLALGYLVFRGALETINYMITATAWLALFQFGRDAAAGGADASGLRGAGAALARIIDVTGPVTTIFFLAGAAMFYWVLYRARLVPRWLSIWGLVGIIPYLIEGILKMYAVISPSAALGDVLDAPLALQEMTLAVWLIVKGFNETGVQPDQGEGEGEATTRRSQPRPVPQVTSG